MGWVSLQKAVSLLQTEVLGSKAADGNPGQIEFHTTEFTVDFLFKSQRLGGELVVGLLVCLII